jgi:hypothetical protein
MQHRIQIGLSRYWVGTDKEPQGTWVAFGDYRSELIVVEGRSEKIALAKWQKTVEALRNRFEAHRR